MSAFHRIDHSRAKFRLPTETERTLPPGQSVIVIAGLSALSWATLTLIVLALRAAL